MFWDFFRHRKNAQVHHAVLFTPLNINGKKKWRNKKKKEKVGIFLYCDGRPIKYPVNI